MQLTPLACVSRVVVPAKKESDCPIVKVLEPVKVIMPTVFEATKYEGAVTAPFISGWMPRNAAVEEAKQRTSFKVPANGATATGT